MIIFQFILNDTASLARPASGFISGPIIAVALFVFVIVTVGGLIVWKLLGGLQKPELYGLRLDQIHGTWEEIEKNSEHGILGAKLAVIEADKLLDSVLRSMAVPGETMGERLKAAEYKFQNIRNVWPAHKLRNQLVHDSSFHMSIRQGKRALKEFEAALKLLKVL